MIVSYPYIASYIDQMWTSKQIISAKHVAQVNGSIHCNHGNVTMAIVTMQHHINYLT